MVQEYATENRARNGGWGTRATSSGTCISGMHDYICTGDVLFYMYNHFAGNKVVSRRAELPKAEVVGRETESSMLTVTSGRSFSTLEYFKKLLSEFLTGNNNYASLLPQTIGIKR